MSGQRIGFIGAGQMATALGRGFVEAGLIAAEDLLAADPAGGQNIKQALEAVGYEALAFEIGGSLT